MKSPSVHNLQSIAFNRHITPHPIATQAATKILQGPHGANAAVGADGMATLAVAALVGTGLYIGFLGFAGYGMYKFAQDYVLKKA